MSPNPAPIDATPLDTIAGAKMLEERVRFFSLYPGQAVLHGERRATLIRISKEGAAIIGHWGESRAVAVRPESLSPCFPRSSQVRYLSGTSTKPGRRLYTAKKSRSSGTR